MKFKMFTLDLYILSSGEKFLNFLLDKGKLLWYTLIIKEIKQLKKGGLKNEMCIRIT